MSFYIKSGGGADVSHAVLCGATQAQLLAAQPGALPQAPPDGAGRHTCVGLLAQAEQSLARIPPGQGPVSLALIRSYLTDAIVETTGREP